MPEAYQNKGYSKQLLILHIANWLFLPLTIISVILKNIMTKLLIVLFVLGKLVEISWKYGMNEIGMPLLVFMVIAYCFYGAFFWLIHEINTDGIKHDEQNKSNKSL